LPRPNSSSNWSLWPWLLWLVLGYAVWLFLVVGLGYWETARSHWPMAVAMAFGSYFAGATPMGGGTVGFPVLVLLFDMPTALGRDFSFAVQSVGMTSASLFIFVRRQPLAWSMLGGALAGSAVGTSLGLLFIAPFVSEVAVKLLFAVVWAGFGLLHLARIDEISGLSGILPLGGDRDRRLGFALGLGAGALVASVTGVGIDMVLYAALVLLCRADLKIAIPTSVVLMAWTSLLGIAVRSATGEIDPEVFGHWLAAAPVVIVGAPLGALVVDLVGRRPTLLLVAVLCVGQLVWTCWVERSTLGWAGTAAAVVAVAVLLGVFEALRRRGARRAERAAARAEQVA
jgi:uncharacterized membrane protein YfcA